MLKNLWKSEIEIFPFNHFFCNSCISSNVTEGILQWLISTNSWKRVNEYFYDQYEFSLYDAKLPDEILFLKENFFCDELKSFIENKFDVVLKNKVDIVAHKLISGDKIKIHNDFIEGQESHRILFHFNKNWKEENGGYFMIFSKDEPESLEKIIPPLHGSVQGFEISQNSHHAVSQVYDFERYTVIYSFYRKGNENI